MSHFIERDGVRIHYLRHDGPAPPMVLIHGLTANAHSFGSLIRAGLTETRGALMAVDLRGRGLSDKPPTGYSVAEHAADVIALLDHHGIDRTVICGHSYGGLVTLYMASGYPDRVDRAIVIAIAGPSIHKPQVLELIRPSLDRLGKVFPSRDAYLATMRAMPALGDWDPDIERFYDADIDDQADGTVRVRIPLEVIQQVITEGQKVDWMERMARVRRRALLLHALGGYGPPGAPPLVLEDQAREAAALLPDCRYAQVPGNHLTMLLGENARATLAHIRAFLAG